MNFYDQFFCAISHWIHGGTSAKMKEKDKEIFALAHTWLTGFAEGKIK